MQITEPTKIDIDKWKKVFEDRVGGLKPNRISGIELDSYFRNTYDAKVIENDDFLEVTKYNLFETIPNYMEKYNKEPSIIIYRTDDNAYVGIDVVSGFFCVEAECIELTASIYDDLFLKRGLDEDDLKNYFLVYQYVSLKDR